MLIWKKLYNIFCFKTSTVELEIWNQYFIDVINIQASLHRPYFYFLNTISLFKFTEFYPNSIQTKSNQSNRIENLG